VQACVILASSTVPGLCRPSNERSRHDPNEAPPFLNLVEFAFSKMARSFLRHIRVTSLDELRHRILADISEMNAQPVHFQSKNFDFQMISS